jgi:outer membrane receptor protein involved in Fe transport
MVSLPYRLRLNLNFLTFNGVPTPMLLSRCSLFLGFFAMVTLVWGESTGVTDLEAVTVKAVKVSTSESKSALTPVTLDLKEKRSQAADLKQVLQAAPGLHIRQNGGAGSEFSLNINGLQGKAIRIFIDGSPLDAASASLVLQTMSVEDLDRVEIYKGVLPTELGADALGGGINFVTRKLRSNSADGSYQIGSYGEHRLQGHVRRELGSHAYFRVESGWGIANNDYPMRVLAVNPITRKQEEQEVIRFHDGFHFSQVEVRIGSDTLPVLGALEAGFKWRGSEKEYQHGISAFAPYGEVEGKVGDLSPRLQWQRNWLAGDLHADLNGEYLWSRLSRIDTSSRKYFWDGNFQPTPDRTGGEIDATYKSLAKLQNHTVTVRGSLRYAPDSLQAFILGMVGVDLERYGDDLLGVRLLESGMDPLTLPSRYRRFYSTLGYQRQWDQGRISSEIIGKHYAYNLKGPGADYGYWNGENIRRSDHYFGGAAAIKWLPLPDWFARLSYERSLRFPDQDELLGDLSFQLPNYYLVPERSHNVNLAMGWNNGRTKTGRLVFDVNVFARLQDSLIVQRTLGLIYSIYRNEGHARSTGVELGSAYSPWNGGKIEINTTYQDIRKLSAQDRSEEYLIDSRLPNIPFFFGNFGFNQGFKSLFGSGDALELGYGFRYVQDFLLYSIPKSQDAEYFWQKPNVKTEYIIPSQFVQYASMVYHVPGKWLSLALEARNLFDEPIYDNFRVPKSGRTFHAKLRANY